jgi:osmotically-inducible protein OsmY
MADQYRRTGERHDHPSRDFPIDNERCQPGRVDWHPDDDRDAGTGRYAEARAQDDRPSRRWSRDRTAERNYRAFGPPFAEDDGRQYRYGGDHDSGRRGLLDRAGDEVASWFGDEEAERRRRADKHRGHGPKGYIRSSDRIHEDVCDRLTDDPLVDARKIEVEVDGTEVTLSGTVGSRVERRRAEAIAESVSGVTHVQNNMRVEEDANPVPAGAGVAAKVRSTGARR